MSDFLENPDVKDLERFSKEELIQMIMSQKTPGSPGAFESSESESVLQEFKTLFQIPVTTLLAKLLESVEKLEEFSERMETFIETRDVTSLSAIFGPPNTYWNVIDVYNTNKIQTRDFINKIGKYVAEGLGSDPDGDLDENMYELYHSSHRKYNALNSRRKAIYAYDVVRRGRKVIDNDGPLSTFGDLSALLVTSDEKRL